MGESIYLAEYKWIWGNLNKDEIDFIIKYVPQNEDGIYYLYKEGSIDTLEISLNKAKISNDYNKSKLSILISKLRKALRVKSKIEFSIF